MNHGNAQLGSILAGLDLGSSVAESDKLLETARVETSAFADLFNDRVDLVPGTKGSGKSALFRIFVDFLPDLLIRQRKVVVAHGIDSPGDPVFHAFNKEFSQLTEQQFVSFWCIYLVSLAHEQFIKGPRYGDLLKKAAKEEVQAFRRACERAQIPEIQAKKTLRDILQWALHVLAKWSPKVKYKLPDNAGEIEVDLFGTKSKPTDHPPNIDEDDALPAYINEIKQALEAVLRKSDLSLWLMIDRLDEIFPRRSTLERTALRGLLRAMRFFTSEAIRVKIFFRDDMLDQVIRGGDGFTALTHVTVRQADTLRWTQDQILSMVVKRIFSNDSIREYLKIDRQRLDASAEYRSAAFYSVFPATLRRGERQTSTLNWLYTRCADGREVVTPRDVIDLLTRAKQRQQDDVSANTDGQSESIIGPQALQYGLQELSRRKRQTYLEAEFPHLWEHIKKFVGGKTEYDEQALRAALRPCDDAVIEDLVSVGLVTKRNTRDSGVVYWIPYVYRHGLELTQGKASASAL